MTGRRDTVSAMVARCPWSRRPASWRLSLRPLVVSGILAAAMAAAASAEVEPTVAGSALVPSVSAALDADSTTRAEALRCAQQAWDRGDLPAAAAGLARARARALGLAIPPAWAEALTDLRWGRGGDLPGPLESMTVPPGLPGVRAADPVSGIRPPSAQTQVSDAGVTVEASSAGLHVLDPLGRSQALPPLPIGFRLLAVVGAPLVAPAGLVADSTGLSTVHTESSWQQIWAGDQGRGIAHLDQADGQWQRLDLPARRLGPPVVVRGTVWWLTPRALLARRGDGPWLVRPHGLALSEEARLREWPLALIDGDRVWRVPVGTEIPEPDSQRWPDELLDRLVTGHPAPPGTIQVADEGTRWTLRFTSPTGTWRVREDRLPRDQAPTLSAASVTGAVVVLEGDRRLRLYDPHDGRRMLETEVPPEVAPDRVVVLTDPRGGPPGWAALVPPGMETELLVAWPGHAGSPERRPLPSPAVGLEAIPGGVRVQYRNGRWEMMIDERRGNDE